MLLPNVYSLAAVITLCCLCWRTLSPALLSSVLLPHEPSPRPVSSPSPPTSALLPQAFSPPPVSTLMTTYLQRSFSLTSRKRGCHLVTDEILSHLSSDLSTLSIGLLHLFIQHTSASLSLNENYDTNVRLDMEDALTASHRRTPATAMMMKARTTCRRTSRHAGGRVGDGAHQRREDGAGHLARTVAL